MNSEQYIRLIEQLDATYVPDELLERLDALKAPLVSVSELSELSRTSPAGLTAHCALLGTLAASYGLLETLAAYKRHCLTH